MTKTVSDILKATHKKTRKGLIDLELPGLYTVCFRCPTAKSDSDRRCRHGACTAYGSYQAQ